MAQQVGRRPFIRVVSPTRWFFRDRRYLRYMAREITCVFIGAYTVLLIVGLARLAAGPEAYGAFLQSLQSPAGAVLLVLTLAFSLYHSFTWFNLAPKALPVQVGERFLPNAVIAGAHYLVWAAGSAAVLFLAGAF
jgi:fumarate reductase subunit C